MGRLRLHGHMGTRLMEPLVKVDTDGRGNLLKLTREQANAYVAAHAGAKIVGLTVAATSEGVTADGPDFGIAQGGIEYPPESTPLVAHESKATRRKG